MDQSINNQGTIEIIGAGLGRTGTLSLKRALEILGYYPTYHMVENICLNHTSFWLRVYNDKEYDFDEIYLIPGVQYKATVDWPSAPYWEALLNKYPNAKVILTVRDPKKWYKSCCDTIFRLNPYSPFCSLGTKIAFFFGYPSQRFAELLKKMASLYYEDWSEESLIRYFNDHNANVFLRCPQDKLLIYEISQGWEPLCRFLKKPIPDLPFPHVNDTAEFQKIIWNTNLIGYSLLAVSLALPLTVFICTKCLLNAKR